MVAFAERQTTVAPVISRCSLNIVSTRFASRSIAPRIGHLPSDIPLMHMPTWAGPTAQATPPLAEFIAHNGQELCCPVANSLMADLEAAEEQDLAQVP
jgi:hypothetical protein